MFWSHIFNCSSLCWELLSSWMMKLSPNLNSYLVQVILFCMWAKMLNFSLIWPAHLISPAESQTCLVAYYKQNFLLLSFNNSFILSTLRFEECMTTTELKFEVLKWQHHKRAKLACILLRSTVSAINQNKLVQRIPVGLQKGCVCE